MPPAARIRVKPVMKNYVLMSYVLLKKFLSESAIFPVPKNNTDSRNSFHLQLEFLRCQICNIAAFGQPPKIPRCRQKNKQKPVSAFDYKFTWNIICEKLSISRGNFSCHLSLLNHLAFEQNSFVLTMKEEKKIECLMLPKSDGLVKKQV